MKPIKYYYRLLFFGIIFPVLLISASLSCFYSWKNNTKISSLVSKEIKPRVEAVINSLVSSISEEVFSERKTIERILLKGQIEFDRAIINAKGYETVDGQLVKEKTRILLKDTPFTDVAFYVFDQEGNIKWVTEPDSGISTFLKDHEFLSALKMELDERGTCLYPFTFVGNLGVGRAFVFKRLSNGDIIGAAFILNPGLYLPQIKRIKDLSVFIQSIKILNAEGVSLLSVDSSFLTPLKWWEFYKRDLKATLSIPAFGAWSEKLNVLLRLNFFEMYSIFLLGVLIFLVMFLLTYCVALNEYSIVKKDLSKIQSWISTVDSSELPRVEIKGFKLKEIHDVALTLNSLVDRLKEEEIRSVSFITKTKEAFFDFAEKLAVVAESYEHMTGEHLMRVKYLTSIIVNRLKIDRDYADEIINYSVLHDIGKIYIPLDILKMKRELNSEEWELVKKHTILGANLFSDDEFRVAKEICLYHHENYDGSGYPFGLKGEEIPLPGRIVRIVDVYDALRSERPYKKAYSHSKALKIMTEGDDRTKPADFDPQLLAIFVEEIEKIDHQKLYEGK